MLFDKMLFDKMLFDKMLFDEMLFALPLGRCPIFWKYTAAYTECDQILKCLIKSFK